MSPSSYTNKKAGVCIFYVISYKDLELVLLV